MTRTTNNAITLRERLRTVHCAPEMLALIDVVVDGVEAPPVGDSGLSRFMVDLTMAVERVTAYHAKQASLDD